LTHYQREWKLVALPIRHLDYIISMVSPQRTSHIAQPYGRIRPNDGLTNGPHIRVDDSTRGVTVLGELISGFVGSTLTELVGKVWPPQNSSPLDRHDLVQRNRSLWITTVSVWAATFFGIFLLIENDLSTAWLIGFWFGAPSLVMMLVLATMTAVKGTDRTKEFLRYCETRDKLNFKITAFLHVSLALLGTVSLGVLTVKLI
jgi:hypothetical protein